MKNLTQPRIIGRDALHMYTLSQKVFEAHVVHEGFTALSLVRLCEVAVAEFLSARVAIGGVVESEKNLPFFEWSGRIVLAWLLNRGCRAFMQIRSVLLADNWRSEEIPANQGTNHSMMLHGNGGYARG